MPRTGEYCYVIGTSGPFPLVFVLKFLTGISAQFFLLRLRSFKLPEFQSRYSFAHYVGEKVPSCANTPLSTYLTEAPPRKGGGRGWHGTVVKQKSLN